VRWVERVTDFARIVFFDKRGTGMSDPTPSGRPPTLEERMDDLRAVKDAGTAIRTAVRELDLQVRGGIHVGEIEMRGQDISGIAVHIAQRVSGLAAPGETLVSRTVTDLVAGSGIEFEGRGEHELKRIPGSWALYAVKG